MDTGALYRGVALAARRSGIAADDDPALTDLCRTLDLSWVAAPQGMRLMLNGAAVDDAIRDPEISMLASAVSARPPVREFLLRVQRRLAAAKNVVAEGRDMGTVVFPHADIKFYLDADLEIRARRRHAELALKKSPPPSLESVENDMQRRDRNDSSRQLAPLKPAADAIRIDSTHLDAQQVVALMLSHIARLQG